MGSRTPSAQSVYLSAAIQRFQPKHLVAQAVIPWAEMHLDHSMGKMLDERMYHYHMRLRRMAADRIVESLKEFEPKSGASFGFIKTTQGLELVLEFFLMTPDELDDILEYIYAEGYQKGMTNGSQGL